MNGIFCETHAENFHSVSICRVFCYLCNKHWNHLNTKFPCYCLECMLMQLFNRIIVSREDQRYLFVLNVNNYDVCNDLEILRRLIILNDG